jgi:hypothetical protein
MEFAHFATEARRLALACAKKSKIDGSGHRHKPTASFAPPSPVESVLVACPRSIGAGSCARTSPRTLADN